MRQSAFMTDFLDGLAGTSPRTSQADAGRADAGRAAPARRIMAIGRVAAVLGLTAALVACGSLSNRDDSSEEAFVDRTAEVFYTGYDQVVERYVDPVQPDFLALASLDGINRLDDEFRIVRRSNRIAILYQGKSVAEMVAPASDDVDGWADTTALALASARRHSPRLAGYDEERLLEASLDSMTDSLDRYSRYENSDESVRNRASRQGYSGIGAALGQDEESGTVTIAKVFEGSPAEKAGVLEGDRILAIDGTRTEGLEVAEVAELMRGQIGTKVEVTIGRGTEESVKQIWRDRVIEPTVFYEPVGNIAYLQISYFNAGTTNGVRDKVNQAAREIGDSFGGIILDLRQNRGGNLSQAIEVSDLFIEDGLILRTAGRGPRANRDYVAQRAGTLSRLPIVVLIDSGSASASEIVASALQDANRALVIGTRSFGKGTIQDIIRLPNDSDLIFTSARMHAPSGYTLSNFGVFPSICTQEIYGKADAQPDLSAEAIARNEALRHRREADRLDKTAKEKLTVYCTGNHPPRPDDDDVRVARSLLESRDLFRQAFDASRVALNASAASQQF